MQTFEDVIASAVRLDQLTDYPEWPLGLAPKGQVKLTGGRKLILPKAPAGVLSLGSGGIVSGLTPEESARARSALVSRSAFRMEVRAEAGLLDEFWLDKRLPKIRQTTSFVGAIQVCGTSADRFGIGECHILQNAIHLGSHGLVLHDDRWFKDRHEFLVELVLAIKDAPTNIGATAEPSGTRWSTWVVLLRGVPRASRPEIVRMLQFAAGLLSVTLRIEFDADARFETVSRSLRQRPPDGLLIWESEVRSAEKFAAVFNRAHSQGLVDSFAPAEPDNLASVIADLLTHLELFLESPSADTPLDWAQGRGVVEDFECPSFVISDRARKQLDSNSYPDPGRMVEHLGRLARLAQQYADKGAQLGTRIEDAGMKLGIEVALFDSKLDPPPIMVAGVVISQRAQPHVKVDDYKSPNECGRIYFAIDTVNLRFIVDHIGLHDYGG